ncbi:MAG TPA: hypothetical protein VFZ61_12285, partial [Polyangiales bacterium]
EDRTLVQLPPGAMPEGDYTVYIGAYRRSDNQRLKVVQGMSDGQGRIALGKLSVKPLIPLLHALIPRTDVEQMRAHPERIVEPHPQLADRTP